MERKFLFFPRKKVAHGEGGVDEIRSRFRFDMFFPPFFYQGLQHDRRKCFPQLGRVT